jgi:hypothetical protein
MKHTSYVYLLVLLQSSNTWQYSLWIKPTDALNSNFTGITSLHVSGSLSANHQEFLAVHLLWYILCSCDCILPEVGWDCKHSVYLTPTLILLSNLGLAVICVLFLASFPCTEFSFAPFESRPPDTSLFWMWLI